MKADAYAYRDRRNRKRDFRRLWITRINAAARAEGMTYGDVHPRPEAGRHRAGPQGAGRHRRARPRDVPPICRARPRGLGGLGDPEHPEAFTGAPPTGAAPFFSPMTASPAPTTKRSRRSASSPAAAGATSCATFVAEGEDLVAAAERGRLAAERGLRRARAAGWTAMEVAPHVLAEVSQLGSGTRALGVYPQRWARARPGRLRRAVGRQRPRQRRHRAARRARVRRGQRRARARERRPVRPQGGPRVDGRAVLRAGRARAQRRRAARPARRARRPRGRAARTSSTATVTLVVGAEREGLPEGVVAACDDVAPHPDRPRGVAQRRHGGDHRPLRAVN